MGLHIRSSKFRNVFGLAFKKDECYEGLRIAHSSAGDSSIIKVNPKFLSVTWETTGGGAFAVLPLASPCRLPENQPLFNAHKNNVLDTDFSPFNDNIIASGSEDCTVMVWNIPEDIVGHQGNPLIVLNGHQRRVNLVGFHPTAANVLGSASSDNSIKIWDVNTAKSCVDLLGHGDAIQSFSFNWNGNTVASTCRDKMMRVFDARSAAVAHKVMAYDGVKTARAIWAGDQDRIITTGFIKSSERQINIWDLRNMAVPTSKTTLDRSPGTLLPYYDRETSVLFIAGKGDSTISYYEHVDGELFHLSDYKSAEPQRGIAFIPKRICRTAVNEIARAYKVHSTHVEPIAFIVPRRAACFQSDIYPPTPGPEPPLTADEWFSGKTMVPILIDMDSKLSGSTQFLQLATPGLNASNNALSENTSRNEAAQDLAAERKIFEATLALKDKKILELENLLSKVMNPIAASIKSDASSSRASSPPSGSRSASPSH